RSANRGSIARRSRSATCHHHCQPLAHSRRPSRRAQDPPPQIRRPRLGRPARRSRRVMRPLIPRSKTHLSPPSRGGAIAPRRKPGDSRLPLGRGPLLAGLAAVLLAVPFLAQQPGGQGKGGKGGGKGAAPTGRAAAAFDPTGYWVSVVTEDW